MPQKKPKLLASAVGLDEISQIIGSYFYSSNAADLRESHDGIYTVHYPRTSKHAGEIMPKYQVRYVKGRYRFEELQ
jgi:hypothetical protein